MSSPPIEEYIEKLNITPPVVAECLRNIRQLDKELLRSQIQIDSQRQLALEKVMEYEEKKTNKQKEQIDQILKSINKLHKKMLDISNKKMQQAQRMYNFIDEPTEDLDYYLTNHPPPVDTTHGPGFKLPKSKRAKKQNQWQQNIGEPYYCYCSRPSFGIMIKCDNPFCETEWFHTECIEEKNPNQKEKWYCRQCRGKRAKGRSTRQKRK